MGVLPFHLFPPPCNVSISASPSISLDIVLQTMHKSSSVEGANLNYAVPESLHNSVSTITGKRFRRRLILQFLGLNHIICHAFPALAAPIMPDMNEPEVIRTFKLPSGVRIQDIVEGEGPEAHSGDLVEFNYVCRRANGYFVYSTVDQFSGESKPVVLPLDENQMIVGLKEVLTGMKLGGKRRALIPPSAGYVNENLKPIPEEVRYTVFQVRGWVSTNPTPTCPFGPRRSLFSHAQEPLVFEVQLLKIWVMTLEPPSVFN
ncbi:putative peptidylprolyl isomerase [Lupinus albus]|uniref:peptidylprolyl isomerase n=1 Tax=Lupinus albus TaxID=3870 RepID=A0A6A4P1G2_LUPAL|nr:putative peptidylprolyl isomerase [Lupinus albus]